MWYARLACDDVFSPIGIGSGVMCSKSMTACSEGETSNGAELCSVYSGDMLSSCDIVFSCKEGIR